MDAKASGARVIGLASEFVEFAAKEAAVLHDDGADSGSDPLRRAVDTIGATISAAMEGKKGAEVVLLPRSSGKAR